MTLRRVVALAQALAIILLLAPGPDAGSSSVLAAVRAPLPDDPAALAFDAVGTGIGCQAGTQRFRGPRTPGDPPWPPGAEPTPSPEPSLVPSAPPSTEPSATGAASPTAEPSMALLAAEVSAPPVATPEPSAGPESSAQPVPSLPLADPAMTPGSPDDADIAPDVPSAPQVRGRVRDLGLLNGIDISHHNGDIDFDKVRAAGNAFVFAKASQDDDFVDPMFVTNMARARQAGLAAGGYHFFDYTLDGRDQADHFVDRLELAGAIDGALPPVVDVECWAPVGISIHAVSAARLRDFVARVYERTGRLPIIYTSVFMWRQVVGNAEGFEDLPLWAACWGCQAPPSIAPGWNGWDFWQTGVGRVRGVGRLDANVFSGDGEDLEALRLRPFGIADGAPATARSHVSLDLGGRTATHLRTSADGVSWTDWSVVRGQPRATIGREEGLHELYVQLRTGRELVSPVFSDAITLDETGPDVSPPRIRLRLAPLDSEPGQGGGDGDGDVPSIPVEATWEAVDPAAGLSDASIRVSCGPTFETQAEAPGSAAPGRAAPWTAAVSLQSGAGCEVSVIGRDGVGNETRVTAEARVATVAVGDGGDRGADTAEVTGDQVGIIARRGADQGRAAIYLDGEAVDLVDLYSPSATEPEVVYVIDLPSEGSGTISVEATGSSHPDAAGIDVVIDAFVTLDAD